MRYVFLFILFTILTTSCSLSLKNRTIFQKQISFLTNDSVKYWSDAWKIPYYQQYKEGGIALYKNGNFHEYQLNYENMRIIVDNLSKDITCRPSKFFVHADTVFLNKCGGMVLFKIVKLTVDTLQLEELTNYSFFPDSIPAIYVISRDQNTKPVMGNLINPDTNTWPVRALPINK